MEQEFWNLVPTEYYALVKTWTDKEYRSFIKAGVVASTIANIHRDPQRKPEPFSPEDFAPRRRSKYLTIEESEAVLVAFTNALGGKDLRNSNGE